MKIILAAILFLAPHLEPYQARHYAKLVDTLSRVRDVDPFLVLSIIRVESNFATDAKSDTRDYGLMQLHVSRTTFRELRGSEWLLTSSPSLNIYLGTGHLSMLRDWHHKRCSGDHAWWRHYKWGFKRKFPDRVWADRILAFHRQLTEKFRGTPWQRVTERSTATASPGCCSLSAKNSWRYIERCPSCSLSLAD